jgi:hypothetical protein
MSAHGAEGNGVGDRGGTAAPADPLDRRVAEGVDHLQAAALEMISAARAFLDVVEELVGDREKLGSLVEAVGSVAEGIGRAARSAPSGDPDGTAPGAAPEGRVEHIRVS